MPRLPYIAAYCLALALPYWAAAQAVATADSASLAVAVGAATQHYTQATQDESVLYSGPEYVDHTRPGTVGHQCLGAPAL